jgi:hypothetical protein
MKLRKEISLWEKREEETRAKNTPVGNDAVCG